MIQKTAFEMRNKTGSDVVYRRLDHGGGTGKFSAVAAQIAAKVCHPSLSCVKFAF